MLLGREGSCKGCAERRRITWLERGGGGPLGYREEKERRQIFKKDPRASIAEQWPKHIAYLKRKKEKSERDLLCASNRENALKSGSDKEKQAKRKTAEGRREKLIKIPKQREAKRS